VNLPSFSIRTASSMLSNFRNMKASTRTSVFVSKEDSEALYENMDKDGIEKAFRELLVLEDSSVRKITSYS
jgi:hypothetical protein